MELLCVRLLVSQCQHISGPMAIFCDFLQDAGFKSRFFRDLRYSRCSSGFANCLLAEEITLWICFVCAAVIHVGHIGIIKSVEWSWLLQGPGLLSSVLYFFKNKVKLVTNQNAMNMNGAKGNAPIFSLPLNLERSLFEFASACTCISPQARWIMNSTFAILKAFEATIQLLWRSYAERKEAGFGLRTTLFIWSHNNWAPLALIIGQPQRETQGSNLSKGRMEA